MRKRFLFIVLLLVGSILLFNIFDQEENVVDFDPLKIEIGEVFECLNYEKEMYILNYEISDMDNDSENDIVIVLGEKTDTNDVYKNIDVILYNKATETFITSKLKNFDGKQPKIELNDIDGDGFKDVIVITILENKDNSMRIISFKDNIAKELFKSREGKGFSKVLLPSFSRYWRNSRGGVSIASRW